MNEAQPGLQQRSLTFYGEFMSRRKDWRGELVLAAFPTAAGCGFSAAASLAGAASLTVDADATAMKANFRDGAFDFVVNTLDEALRALKNEVRKKQPIALGLIASPDMVLREAEERGIETTMRWTSQESPSAEYVQWLADRGWFARPHSLEEQLADDRLRQRWWQDLPLYQRSARGPQRWGWATL